MSNNESTILWPYLNFGKMDTKLVAFQKKKNTRFFCSSKPTSFNVNFPSVNEPFKTIL